jgi:hypothetical protein
MHVIRLHHTPFAYRSRCGIFLLFYHLIYRGSFLLVCQSSLSTCVYETTWRYIPEGQLIFILAAVRIWNLTLINTNIAKCVTTCHCLTLSISHQIWRPSHRIRSISLTSCCVFVQEISLCFILWSSYQMAYFTRTYARREGVNCYIRIISLNDSQAMKQNWCNL